MLGAGFNYAQLSSVSTNLISSGETGYTYFLRRITIQDIGISEQKKYPASVSLDSGATFLQFLEFLEDFLAFQTRTLYHRHCRA